MEKKNMYKYGLFLSYRVGTSIFTGLSHAMQQAFTSIKSCKGSVCTELEQWNANIAFAQVNLSPLADHKPGNWLFPV